MNNKTKYWIGLIGIIGVLSGRILNRVASKYLGSDGSNIVIVTAGVIIFCCILGLIATKHYKIAIISFVMAIPLSIASIGVYINNMDILGLGLLSFFIMLSILTIVIKKFK